MSDTTHYKDLSNGWDAAAIDFIALRNRLTGADIIADWSRSFVKDNDILDIGCGFGGSYTQHLSCTGVNIHAIDASPALLQEYRRCYPDIPARCEAAEHSTFFDKQFDGILAIGLLFLLSREKQDSVLLKMATALKHGGKLLFTCPYQVCEWDDLLTGRQSLSHGKEAYINTLGRYGLRLCNEYTDEGKNHYFDLSKE